MSVTKNLVEIIINPITASEGWQAWKEDSNLLTNIKFPSGSFIQFCTRVVWKIAEKDQIDAVKLDSIYDLEDDKTDDKKIRS